MQDHTISTRLLSVLLGALLLAGCDSNRGAGAPASGTAALEADVFQDHWEGGGGTLLIRSLDGEIVWRNRIGTSPGAHEVLFQYEATTACAPQSGCAVRRYHDRITFDAEADRSYRLRAGIEEDGALRAEINDLANGRVVASVRTREAVLQHEGYPKEAWQVLCDAADRGDAQARRAIGLHYWSGWWPAERDVVLAYQWLSLATQAYDSVAAGFREKLAGEMTSEQIEEAERRTAGWKPGICMIEAKLK